MVKMKALPMIRYWPPTKPAPRIMASDAPKDAAEEIPSVKGLASGFLRMPCIAAPATASPIPANMAIATRCSRSFQTMVSKKSLVWK